MGSVVCREAVRVQPGDSIVWFLSFCLFGSVCHCLDVILLVCAFSSLVFCCLHFSVQFRSPSSILLPCHQSIAFFKQCVGPQQQVLIAIKEIYDSAGDGCLCVQEHSACEEKKAVASPDNATAAVTIPEEKEEIVSRIYNF